MRAAIFDLDGTIVDNMRWHARAWTALVRREGRRESTDAELEAFLYAQAGRKNEELIPELLGRAATPAEVSRLSSEKEELYRELYRPYLEPLAGFITLLGELERAGVALAIASAAPRPNRDFVLDGLDLRRRFRVIVGAEDAERGKPAPDMFLAAARRLGLAPGVCVVFEDALNGVRAAAAAGMECVAVTTTAREDDLRAAGARWVLPDLTRPPDDLRAALGL